MGQLGIITGLASEAGCLGGIVDPAGCRVRCAGADGRRAAELAWHLVGQGCTALLSFGTAGGLDPRLPSGHLVVADRVMADNRTYECDSPWGGRVEVALTDRLPVTKGTLMGVGEPVTSADDKHRLHAAGGAVALDMESHAVAEAARQSGIPFLALRAIADTAAQAVPPWLPAVINDKGDVAFSAFLRGLAAHPADWPGIVRLAGANRRALASLRRAVALLGPCLGLL